MSYQDFCQKKLEHAAPVGIESVPPLGDHLFPFQRDLVRVALERGRCALFADTGLGKSAMQIEWARVIADHTGGRVLILAPLAVAAQTSREGDKFGVKVTRVNDGSEVDEPGIYVTNYDKLHRFEDVEFDGVVLDESSILKDYTSATRNQLNERFAATPFKLCCTATPAPNDFTELGNHAQFLGIRTREEMLAEFFVHDGGSTQDWRVKGHAEAHFWEWVSTWALVIRRPSDLGYDDGGFALPELVMQEVTVDLDESFAKAAGVLFLDEAKGLSEQRAVRRASMPARVEAAARVVASEPNEPWLLWCEMNDEGDALERAVADAVQVAGSDSPEDKEARMVAFSEGDARVLVSKPGICGFGMNWQHCARILFVGVTHSFEQFYQAIRRCWRFGQTRTVVVYMVASSADGAILANLKRKEKDARKLAEQASAHIIELTKAAAKKSRSDRADYVPRKAMTVPEWLTSEEEAA
jgi:superfamily II DNA or RNA helicase